MTWVKGKSGNPNGRPKTAPEELVTFRKLARSKSNRALRVAFAIMDDEGAKPEARLRAAEVVMLWSFGKPESATEVAGAPVDYSTLPWSARAKMHMEAAKRCQAEADREAKAKADAPPETPATEQQGAA